jgi:hypothetical protein
MVVKVGRQNRTVLYQSLLDDLSAIGDIYLALSARDIADAQRLRHRFDADLQLLDHLGWEREPDRYLHEVVMPRDSLAQLLTRLYWDNASGLADPDQELRDDTAKQLRGACEACALLLWQLAESPTRPPADATSTVENRVERDDETDKGHRDR